MKKRGAIVILWILSIFGYIPFISGTLLAQQTLNIGGSITQFFEYDGNYNVQTKLMFSTSTAMNMSLSVRNVYLNMGDYKKIHLLLKNESIQQYIQVYNIDEINRLQTVVVLPAGSYSLEISPYAVMTNSPMSTTLPITPITGQQASFTATIQGTELEGGVVPGDPDPIDVQILNIGDQVEQLLAFNGLSHIPSSYSFAIETDAAIAPVILNSYVNMGPGKCIYLNLYNQSTGICITGTPVCESGNTIGLSQITLTAGTYVYKLEPFASVPGVLPMSSGNIGDLPIIDIRHANLTLEISVCQPEPEGPTLPFIEYTYDQAGNITSREYIILSGRSKSNQEARIENEILNNSLKDELLNIKLYPNPTRDYIKIEIPEDNTSQNCRINIYNISGKNYFNGIKQGPVIDLDFSNYPAGTYVLQMIRNGKISTWKILKQN